MQFIIKWLVTAVAAAVAIWLVPGIYVDGSMSSWIAIILFALILALINMIVKPVLQVFSIPITVLTLGVFYLIVNTFCLYIAVWIANGLFGVGIMIDNFWSAFFGAIIISIVSTILGAFVDNDNASNRRYAG